MIPRNIKISILWMIAGQLLFVAVWCAIKFIGTRLPLFEVLFFRSFLSLIPMIPITYFKEGTLKGNDARALFMRAVSGFAAMVLVFYAMIHAPIGNATTLFNTMPIFVAIMAPFFLKERFSKQTFFLILLAFTGIALIFKPDISIFKDASLFALIAGVLAAHAMICVKKLHSSESTLIITFYFTLFSTIFSIPVLLFDFVWPTFHEFMWLLFIGFIVTFAQIFLTRAYKFGRASTIAPFAYTSVVGSYIAGIIFFKEIPERWAIIGTLIIMISGIGVIMTSAKKTELKSHVCS